jgi:hypothetical protein
VSLSPGRHDHRFDGTNHIGMVRSFWRAPCGESGDCQGEWHGPIKAPASATFPVHDFFVFSGAWRSEPDEPDQQAIRAGVIHRKVWVATAPRSRSVLAHFHRANLLAARCLRDGLAPSPLGAPPKPEAPERQRGLPLSSPGVIPQPRSARAPARVAPVISLDRVIWFSVSTPRRWASPSSGSESGPR